MNGVRLLGIAALACLAAGLATGNEHLASYAGQDPEWRPVAALLVTAAWWLVALALALTATIRSLTRTPPPDRVTILLARGPAILVFFAFAIRMFLFAMKNN